MLCCAPFTDTHPYPGTAAVVTLPPLTEIELTTNPGLEGIAFEELSDVCRAAGLEPPEKRDGGMKGRLLCAVAAPWADAERLARTLRSVHHILRPLAHFSLPEGDDAALRGVKRRLADVTIPDLEDGRRSFRVTATRVGDHPYSSDQIAGMAGAGIIDRTGNPVNLKHPDVTVRVDVVDRACSVGIQATDRALSLRHGLAYHQRVSLRTTVAYAMLRMAGLKTPPALVADPFVGSGTLLLEAGALWPDARLWGGDKFAKPVDGARANMRAAGLGDRAEIHQADARDINEILPAGSVDLIVSNPPFGVQLGRRTNFFDFYLRWLRACRPVLGADGRLVALVHKREAFQAACEKAGYRVLVTRIVEASNLFVAIFVIKPFRETPSSVKGAQAAADDPGADQ